MTEDEPVLFDLPGHGRSPLPDPPSPGRRRETWACTVTADVTIHDADAVRNAAESAAKRRGGRAEHRPHCRGPGGGLSHRPVRHPGLLVWPTDGLEELLEAGALRILELNSEVAPESDEACVLSWTVTVKLTDVAALRRIAIRAHPDEIVQMRGRLALAWQHAADPFAPRREIPGITWQPGPVAVRHVPRRSPADNTAGER